MLNYEIGKTYRCFDFSHLRDCFMEGKLVEINGEELILKTTRIVRSGSEVKIAEDLRIFKTRKLDESPDSMDSLWDKPRILMVSVKSQDEAG